MFFYQHNIGDFSSEIRGLSYEQIGILITLMDRFVSTEEPISEAWEDATFKGESKCLANALLLAFFAKQENGFVHKRLQKEIENYKETCEKRKISGKKGAQARVKKASEIKENQPKRKQKASTCLASGKLTINHKPINIYTNKQITPLTEGRASSSDDVCLSGHQENLFENGVADPPDERPLSAEELISEAKKLGIKLSPNVRVDSIASRQRISRGDLKRCAEFWKSTGTKTGYFLGILENVAEDPTCNLSNEPKEPLSAETITDNQAKFFASKLVLDSRFTSKFGQGFDSYEKFQNRVTSNLHIPEFFEEYRPHLERLGFL